MTIPHGHWVAMGLKDHFPEMHIKNTILRKVNTAQDFWYSAEQGFDYINVDRILMRDVEELKNIRRAQLMFQQKYGRYIEIALLTNEGCLGRCPVMDEHYSYNNLRKPNELPYFHHEISKVTCEHKWEDEVDDVVIEGVGGFYIEVDTVESFDSPYSQTYIAGGGVITYITDYLLFGKMHYWRVRPFNANGAGEWSEVWGFETISTEILLTKL